MSYEEIEQLPDTLSAIEAGAQTKPAARASHKLHHRIIHGALGAVKSKIATLEAALAGKQDTIPLGTYAGTKTPGVAMTAADILDLPVDLKAVYGVSAAATAATNTAALNQAIADANAAYVAGLGVRRLKLPGEKGIRIQRRGANFPYSIDGAKNGYELYGEGEGRTEFLIEPFNYDDPASFYQSIFHIKGASAADADLLKDIYLHDFSIDGNRAAMTGTPHANAGDTLDTKWCASSVVLERVTVRNSSSDAFDIDDSTGAIVRFCSAYNAAGYGFHNSENAVGTVMLGNYAEGCGHVLNRGGFDQFLTASQGMYLGNRAKGNYQNYSIAGATAFFFGNVDLGGATVANVMTGVTNGVDPSDGKLLVHGAGAGIRLGDQSDLAQNKRWLISVLGGTLAFFSSNANSNVLSFGNDKNVRINTTATAGASGALILGNATTAPTGGSASAALLYAQAGIAKIRNADGVIDFTRQAALPNTSGATLAALEAEVNAIKAKLRAFGIMA